VSLIANHFILSEISKSIRSLSIDAIEAAGCGHPGLPLGCADIVAVLYANILRHNPANPQWVNRDRFVLSAGHGSMVLYSALHLAGFDLSLQDIKDFRQLHSKTPGHPEFRETPGVETTTGPLGQGVAMAVGMALGLKINEAKYEMASQGLLDARVYVLAGDGDLMEGVSAEASSFAGNLALNNLVII
jgi:transketolase